VDETFGVRPVGVIPDVFNLVRLVVDDGGQTFLETHPGIYL